MLAILQRVPRSASQRVIWAYLHPTATITEPAPRHSSVPAGRRSPQIAQSGLQQASLRSRHDLDRWQQTDTAILTCLQRHGAMSPGALGRHIGVSEAKATVFLVMLVREGKVSVRLIELQTASRQDARPGPPR